MSCRCRLGLRLYAHCVGASNKPRLTVTSHDLNDGSLVVSDTGNNCLRCIHPNTKSKVEGGTGTMHVSAGSVCLSVRHTNTTKCQCVF